MARRLVSLLGLAASLTLAGAAPASSARADDPHFSVADGVVLGPAIRAALGRIARRFHERTGRDIHVTSGTRDARSQAAAMYDKLRRGQRLTRLYRDFQSASEIQTAYNRNRRRGRARCISAMARVIRSQVRSGRYISRHLRASAADVRSRNLNRRQRRIFRQVVREVGGVSLLEEGTPPHFHLQLQ